LQHFLREQADSRVLFCCDSAGRREAMLELLRRIDLAPRVVSGWQEFLQSNEPLSITVAPLESGLWLRSAGLIAITENQLFIHHVSQQRRRGKFQDQSE